MVNAIYGNMTPFSRHFHHVLDVTSCLLNYSNISGDRACDRALASRQSKKCPQKHGGFWPNLRHFDVIIIRIFMVKTTDKLKCGE